MPPIKPIETDFDEEDADEEASSAAFSTGALTVVGAGAPEATRALFKAVSPRLLFTDAAEAVSLTYTAVHASAQMLTRALTHR
jgi:hypothetical protein